MSRSLELSSSLPDTETGQSEGFTLTLHLTGVRATGNLQGLKTSVVSLARGKRLISRTWSLDLGDVTTTLRAQVLKEFKMRTQHKLHLALETDAPFLGSPSLPRNKQPSLSAVFLKSLRHQSSLLGGACRHGLPAGTRSGQVQEENKKDLASGAHSPDEGCALGTRPAQSHALAALGPRS